MSEMAIFRQQLRRFLMRQICCFRPRPKRHRRTIRRCPWEKGDRV